MKIKINNQEYETEENKTILEVATLNNIKIPTLCFLKNINEEGACRICMVEVVGARTLIASCVTKVTEGMEILTDSDRVIESRIQTLKLILEHHNYDCLKCRKNGHCELQRLVYEYDLGDFTKKNKSLVEMDNPSIIRDNSKCILCNRCVATCALTGTCVIGRNDRGIDTHIGAEFDKLLREVNCLKCGQCINACPTGALTEKDDISELKKILEEKKHTIVAFAPAVRVALGEEFNMQENVVGKMATFLRNFGFTKVFDINLTADLTIMEETNELLEHLKENKELPLFTSCCPAWVAFANNYYPEINNLISSCKSPQQMFGAIMKTYYANKNNLKKEDIRVITIMPCTAKKAEKLNDDNIDLVLTTRELARLIKTEKVNFASLEESECDNLFGEGNSVIFGASGGVMESALRTAKSLVDGELKEVNFIDVRGLNGVKEASYEIGGHILNVAIISGLINMRKILADVKNGTSKYQFIEVMTCPGGCINGGGQPYVASEIRNNHDYRTDRMKLLYEIDNKNIKKCAHENEMIKKIYTEYLEKPGSKKALEILHTRG